MEAERQLYLNKKISNYSTISIPAIALVLIIAFVLFIGPTGINISGFAFKTFTFTDEVDIYNTSTVILSQEGLITHAALTGSAEGTGYLKVYVRSGENSYSIIDTEVNGTFDFDEACIDCVLDEEGPVIDVEIAATDNVSVHITEITYSVDIEANEPPNCTQIPDLELLAGEQLVINLNDYCSDPEGKELLYSALPIDNLSSVIEDDQLIISSDIPDSYFVSVYATDGESSTDMDFVLFVYAEEMPEIVMDKGEIIKEIEIEEEMPIPPVGIFAWWNSSWDYKIPINITNSLSYALTNYQVKLKLNSTNFDLSKLQNDCDDIRFTNAGESATLDHWVESCNTTSLVEVWVEMPSIAASSTTQIYIYYGNAVASSTSNGDNTFTFFEDFSSDTLNTAKWDGVTDNGVTISGGIATVQYSSGFGVLETNSKTFSKNKNYYARAKFSADTNSNCMFGYMRDGTTPGSGAWGDFRPNSGVPEGLNFGSNPSGETAETINLNLIFNSYAIHEITWSRDGYMKPIVGGTAFSKSAYIHNNTRFLNFEVYTTGPKILIDYVFVWGGNNIAVWNANTPTYSIGSEEASGAVNCTDDDSDGYGLCPNCGIANNCTFDGNDCNDTVAAINPGATENCTNLVDDDCDGDIDCSDSNCSAHPSCNVTGPVDLDDNSTWGGRIVKIGYAYYINDDVILVTKTYNIPASSPAIVINCSNCTFDCNGSIINGTGNGTGIYNNGHDNVNITNCSVYNYDYGIYYNNADFGYLINDNAFYNGIGVYFYSSSQNTLIDVNASNNVVIAAPLPCSVTLDCPSSVDENETLSCNITYTGNCTGLSLYILGSDTCGGTASDNGNGTGNYSAPAQGEAAGPGSRIAGVGMDGYTDSHVITINEANANPTITTLPHTESGPVNNPDSYDVDATDPDLPAQLLSYSIFSHTCSFTPTIISGSGVVSWTCGAGAETCSVNVRVSDGFVPPGTDTETLTIKCTI